ncbi:MAG: hypothetical protein ACHQJ6_05675 [Candidatus Berkiellales bacterium]
MDTYLEVLPFTLLMAVAQYFFGNVITNLSTGGHHSPLFHTGLFVGVYIIHFMIFCLLFSVALYFMYQRYHQQAVDYGQALMKGGLQVPQVILASLMVYIPIIIAFLIFVLPYLFSPTLTSGFYVNVSFFAVVVLVVVPILLYFYVSPVLIVAKAKNALEGIKQSWELTRGYWLKTFYLLAIFGTFTALISWVLSKLYAGFTPEIMTIISFPLNISLMIIHCDNLENISREKSPALRSRTD